MEVAYYIHMEDQFKNTHKWVQPRYVVNGSIYHIQLSMQEVLLNSMGQNCIEHGNWDRFWYATTEEAMGSCTVPWTMNNSRICSDRTEMARVHSIYKGKEIVSLMQDFVGVNFGGTSSHGELRREWVSPNLSKFPMRQGPPALFHK